MRRKRVQARTNTPALLIPGETSRKERSGPKLGRAMVRSWPISGVPPWRGMRRVSPRRRVRLPGKGGTLLLSRWCLGALRLGLRMGLLGLLGLGLGGGPLLLRCFPG